MRLWSSPGPVGLLLTSSSFRPDTRPRAPTIQLVRRGAKRPWRIARTGGDARPRSGPAAGSEDVACPLTEGGLARCREVAGKLGARMDVQRTLILAKPDAVERNLAGEIVARFERRDLK